MLISSQSSHRGTGELQANTDQLRSIIGALPDAAFVVDQEGLVCFVNPAALDLFNLPAGDLLDKPFAFPITPNIVKQIQITRPRIKNVMAEMRAVETIWGGRKAYLALLRDITDRIEAEQALDDSEERSQVLLKAFPDVLYLLNRQGEYVGYQAHDPQSLFAPPSRFLGRKLSAVFPQAHVELVQPLFEKALQTGQTQTFEYLLEWEGQSRFFEERLVSYDKNNVLSLVRDITERKRVEEASRRYSATLWAISLAAGEFMQSGYSTVTIQNMLERLGQAAEVSRVYIFQNRYAFHQPYAYHLEYEWVKEGTPARLGNPALEEFPMMPLWNEQLGMGKVVFGQVDDFSAEVQPQLEVQGIKSLLSVPIFDGEKWWGFIGFNECTQERSWSEIEIGALRTAAGIISAAIQHMEIDRALRESEQRYRGIVEDQMDFIVRWHPDRAITFVNDSFCRFFGGTRADWLGKTVQDNIYFDDIPDAFLYGEKLVRERTSGIHEHRNVNLKGEPRWCQWRDRVILDAEGHILEVQSVGRDIHEAKLRAREQEGIAVIAAALRGTPTRLETLRVIADKLLELLDGTGVAVAFCTELPDEVHFELGIGELTAVVGKTMPLANVWKDSTLLPGKTLIDTELLEARNVYPETLEKVVVAGMMVPLVSGEHPIGVVLVTKLRKFTEDEMRIFKAVTDIAASAVHRATLYEDTRRRLNRVTALRTLNLAVSGNIELDISLEVLLDQIIAHLGVDAADVLIFEPYAQSLHYRLGRGFWTQNIADTYLRLSSGLAQQAALTRQIVQLEDLPNNRCIGGGWDEVVKNEKFLSYYAVPLIAKGQVKGVLELFSRQHDQHDEEWLGFVEALAADAALAIDHAELFDELQRSNDELRAAYDETILGWSKALELRDKETQGHSDRVVDLTVRLAQWMGFPESGLGVVRRGAILHDIGKMGVPDSILLKPGPLLPEERKIMSQHPEFACQMLSAIPFLQDALDIPYCHHERWDGKGYPRQLRGQAIPLAARIFSVVDVWDALISDRPYRHAWSERSALAYIRSQRGRAFDPDVVDAFLSLMEKAKTS